MRAPFSNLLASATHDWYSELMTVAVVVLIGAMLGAAGGAIIGGNRKNFPKQNNTES